MSQKKNYFTELAKIDVNNYTEKKGQFTYLSWAWAVDQLRRKHPDATWETKKFKNADGIELPYMDGPNGAFVEVSVTVEGITLSEIFPVLDFKNKSVTNPNAFDVNKAIKRCLAKAIANHGLGLYIYAGEDLPIVPEEMITDTQLEELKSKVEQFATMRGRSSAEVFSALKVHDPSGLTLSQAGALIKTVDLWLKKAKEEDTAS